MSPENFGHKTRSSDASSFDEVCTLCGATDRAGSTDLSEPCPKAQDYPPKWSGEITVGNMIANLKTLPPEMPLHSVRAGRDAYTVQLRAGPAVLSMERVKDGALCSEDPTASLHAVIWSAPKPLLPREGYTIEQIAKRLGYFYAKDTMGDSEDVWWNSKSDNERKALTLSTTALLGELA